MKICKKCETEKSLCEFSNNKNNNDGKSLYCKECEKKRKEIYREKNRERLNEDARNWRRENPDRYKKTINKYLDKNPHMTSKERSKKYRENEEWREKFKIAQKKWMENNKDRVIEKAKEYRKNNKEKLKILSLKWSSEKYKNDGFYGLKKNMRNRIRDFMKGKCVGIRTKEIIGLGYDEFKDYLTSKFVEGMTWENYGKWHLDHIKPLCSAKNNDEVLLLNHYTNLQPLWAEDNLKKGGKI